MEKSKKRLDANQNAKSIVDFIINETESNPVENIPKNKDSSKKKSIKADKKKPN